MAKITREDARARIAAYGKRIQKIDHSFPGLEDLDGELGAVELSPKDIEEVQKSSVGPDGTPQDTLMAAGMVARGLVLFDTKERIFTDNDMSIIADLGLSVFSVFSDAISQISGLNADALEAAKKNLLTTRGSGLATT
jgi:hypothetical protein